MVTTWDGTVVATTPRLLLRTFRRDDLPAYAALNAHPAVYEALGGRPLTAAESDELAEWHQQRHAQDGFGLLAVERRADGVFVGMCGLHHQSSYPDDVEVAWRLAPEHWGQGYATEAGAGWLDLAFGRLGLPRVICITDTENVRSLAVMRRLGLRWDHDARIEDDGEVFDAVVHSITAQQWRGRAGRAGRLDAGSGPPPAR